MLPIDLTAAQVTRWNSDADWKQGFLLALKLALNAQPEVQLVVIRDEPNATVLAQYQKDWTQL